MHIMMQSSDPSHQRNEASFTQQELINQVAIILFWKGGVSKVKDSSSIHDAL